MMRKIAGAVLLAVTALVLAAKDIDVIAGRAGGCDDLVSEFREPLSAAFVPELTWSLPPTAKREGDVVTFSVSGEAAKHKNLAIARFDARPYVGKELSITVRARARGLSQPAAHWLGPAFSLWYRDEFTNQMNYPGFRFPKGDFDGEYTLTVPLYGVNPCEGRLCLGIDSASGEISFDLSSIRMSVDRKLFPPMNVGYRVTYPDHVAKRPPLHGMGVDPALKEKDFADLASWGAKLIRYPLDAIRDNTPKAAPMTKAQSIARFRRDTETRLAYFQTNVVGWARKHGVKVVLLLPYGPREGSQTVFNDDVCFEAFRDMWKTVVTRLKGDTDVIYGYDLFNEPSQHKVEKYGYFGLQERVARAIREIDPDTSIIVEASNCDAPDAYSYMSALDLPNVIYEVHVYQPMAYTHQLVGTARKERSAYPRPASATETAIDKEFLRKVLDPVRKFQREHDCKIFVGEFSVTAWAEGGAQYLDDLMSLFDEYGWDWTYLAFRSATLWSVEHGATDSGHRWKAKNETDRKKVLLKWMTKGDAGTTRQLTQKEGL